MQWLYKAILCFGLAVLIEKGRQREAIWSESVAVGHRDYVARVCEALGAMACGRSIRKAAEGWERRESKAPYNADFGDQNGVLGSQNRLLWRISLTISVT
jgi:hypothetical protein